MDEVHAAVAAGGGAGGPPTGTAGGALAGTYPSPTLADPELNALAGLASSADTFPYFSGAGAASLAAITAFVRTLTGSANGVTLRAAAGMAYGKLADVKADFGALGDNSTNDTTAIQAAFDAVTAGTYLGVYFPPGVYVVTPGSLQSPTVASLLIYGSGDTGDTNTGSSRGTYIRSDGTNAGKFLLNLNGCGGFDIRGITFWGNTSASITGAASGVRLQNVAGSGIGSGNGSLRNCGFIWCVEGFDAGLIDGGDGGVHDTGSAADVSFDRCNWTSCTSGFVSNQDQNVNFAFHDCGMAAPTVAIWVKKGGNITAVNLSTFDAVTVLKVDGGSANGWYQFFGVDCDGTAVRTKLFEGAATDIRADFHNVTFNVGQLAVAGGVTRLTIGQFNAVRFYGGRNLCNATGKFFDMSGGNLIVEDADLPSSSTNVVGTVTGGEYRVANCHDESDPGALLDSYGTLDGAYQPKDADLTSIAALGSAADKGLYTTAAHTWAEFALTSFARTILDDADAATVRATIGAGTGSGTVTTFSVVTANGISASVANATTTPAATFTLGAITPTTVNGVTFTGSGTLAISTFTVTVSGNVTALSGSHTGTCTGDQVNISGNAATATKWAATITINGTAVDGSGNVTITAAAGTLTGATLAAGVTASSLTSFGASIALGTPASGVLTNCTGLPIGGGGTGTTTGSADGWTTLVVAVDETSTANGATTSSAYISFSVTSGKAYAVEYFVIFSSDNASDDAAYLFNVNGTTMQFFGMLQTLGTSLTIQNVAMTALGAASTGSQSVGTQGTAGDPTCAKGEGAFTPAANATFLMKFGNSTGTGNVKLHAGSWARYKQLN